MLIMILVLLVTKQVKCGMRGKIGKDDVNDKIIKVSQH